jgi:hypothetical protein
LIQQRISPATESPSAQGNRNRSLTKPKLAAA